MRHAELITERDPDALPLDRPLRAMFLTSVRDVGRRSDNNGEWVRINGTYQYMRGLIEAAVDGINAGAQIADHLDVVGVVYDDSDRELMRDGYTVRPRQGDGWIYPVEKRNRPIGGEPLLDITHRVPSSFRSLPREDLAGRAELKAEFEQKVVDLMRSLEADILISDHLIMRIENLIRSDIHNLYGRVLNIHPAITDANHPYKLRGLTPTQDAIDRANLPNGSAYYRTGSTFHFIGPEIDAGPVITDDESTHVYPADTPMQLRLRNYTNAKIPVFLEGMRHYHQTMFHHVLNNPNFVTQLPNAQSHTTTTARLESTPALG